MKSGARALQRRLKSVRSIAQLTRAMKTAAVSKYNRVLGRFKALEPYEAALTDMAALLGGEQSAPAAGDTVLYLVLTANRGLCGSYNSDLWAFLQRELAREQRPVQLMMLGSWGAERAREQLPGKVLAERPIRDLPAPGDAWALADELEGLWQSGRYAEIVLVWQHFHNILRQTPERVTLLPLSARADQPAAQDLLVLPDRASLTRQVQRRALRMQLLKHLLGAMSGAHGAMLMAMRSANDNAESMSQQLSRRINRLRQSAVTTQVLELSRGNRTGNKRSS